MNIDWTIMGKRVLISKVQDRCYGITVYRCRALNTTPPVLQCTQVSVTQFIASSSVHRSVSHNSSHTTVYIGQCHTTPPVLQCTQVSVTQFLPSSSVHRSVSHNFSHPPVYIGQCCTIPPILQCTQVSVTQFLPSSSVHQCRTVQIYTYISKLCQC